MNQRIHEHYGEEFNRVEPVERPKPYRVRKVTVIDTGNREVVLPSKLQELLNNQAMEDYHPLRFEPMLTGPHRSTYGYIVVFYYAPNGPAFTPPF